MQRFQWKSFRDETAKNMAWFIAAGSCIALIVGAYRFFNPYFQHPIWTMFYPLALSGATFYFRRQYKKKTRATDARFLACAGLTICVCVFGLVPVYFIRENPAEDQITFGVLAFVCIGCLLTAVILLSLNYSEVLNRTSARTEFLDTLLASLLGRHPQGKEIFDDAVVALKRRGLDVPQYPEPDTATDQNQSASS